MVELRNEDQRAFKNFLRMPPEMYDELLERVGPRIAKRHTSCSETRHRSADKRAQDIRAQDIRAQAQGHKGAGAGT